MRAQHAENLGVTLIDLIIVVTLMAVLAGIGLPRMTSMFTISTPEAAGVEAMTSVEYARSTSVASGRRGVRRAGVCRSQRYGRLRPLGIRRGPNGYPRHRASHTVEHFKF